MTRYKLFKVDSGGPKPACAFFFSDKGCKNGASCKFSHTKVEGDNVNMKQCDDSSSVVSSESELSLDVPITNLGKNKNQPKSYPDCTSSKYDDDLCPFKLPSDNTCKKKNEPLTSKQKTPKSTQKKEKMTTDNTPNSKKRKQQQQQQQPQNQCTPIPTKNTAVLTNDNTPNPDSNRKKRKANNNNTPKQSSTPSFRNLNLPIAEFSCYDQETPQSIDDTSSDENTKPVSPSPNKSKVSKKPKMEPPKTPQYPIPNSTEEGRYWQKAVLSTQANSRFASCFDFEKYKALDQEKGTGHPNDWVKARPFGDWCKSNPHAIAIDCEMCETCDPVTGAKDHKALCRLSVVNASNPSEVLIDTLVKPAWPVVDHRSWVNGITKEDLGSVQFTLRHAQAFMIALCSEETVILGHSVENDLVALKMEHHTVADSAYLFNVKDEEHALPSLKDLAFNVLEREMPDTHDSVNDARVTLLCIDEGWVKKDNGANAEQISRVFQKRKKKTIRIGEKHDYSSELFVHRIPRSFTKEHVENLFVMLTNIKPSNVPDIEYGNDTGKATVKFLSGDHSRLAFETLIGDAQPDKTGRLQKRVYLKKGGYVQVRKMVSKD